MFFVFWMMGFRMTFWDDDRSFWMVGVSKAFVGCEFCECFFSCWIEGGRLIRLCFWEGWSYRDDKMLEC